MKLYATVTSERATKGQGGEYLDIELKNELKICFASIKVRGQELEIWYDSETEVKAFKDSAWNREIYDYQKEKQALKDANMAQHATPLDVVRNSKRIVEIQKGEKQKGACGVCGGNCPKDSFCENIPT